VVLPRTFQDQSVKEFSMVLPRTCRKLSHHHIPNPVEKEVAASSFGVVGMACSLPEALSPTAESLVLPKQLAVDLPRTRRQLGLLPASKTQPRRRCGYGGQLGRGMRWINIERGGEKILIKKL
jgi:hypothetical protein